MSDAEGRRISEAWLTVDERVALLHGLGSRAQYARWLLHTAIIERLSASSCQMLLTNSYDAPLLPPGQQYFQQLLGYSVVRLRPRPPGIASTFTQQLRVAALGAVAAIAIVTSHVLPSPFPLAGHRALVWLTALVVIRLMANRGGPTTITGGLAGLGIVVLGAAGTLVVPLAYLLCGAALDLGLALLPRLARNLAGIALTGATVMFVTLIAPAFPTLGHHPAGAPWVISPILGAVGFGAASACLGYGVVHVLRPRTPGATPRWSATQPE